MRAPAPYQLLVGERVKAGRLDLSLLSGAGAALLPTLSPRDSASSLDSLVISTSSTTMASLSDDVVTIDRGYFETLVRR